MSSHQGRGDVQVLGRSSSSASDLHDSTHDALKPDSNRPSLLHKTSAKFDKQVAVLPMRFQTMTRITDMTRDDMLRLDSHRITGSSSVGEADQADRRGSSDKALRNARKSRIKGDEKKSKVENLKATEQPIGLVVALFHDGFVCRHINKENEGVEGFAQPYDAESSYFLACIDNGRVPEGLPDMIACAHYHGSVLAEIRDYRKTRTALCPVSSAFLPAASMLLQADTELDSGCSVWQTLLLPGRSPLSIRAQVSQLLEPPTLQSMFDHFPDVSPSELETLAMDAKQQLLQEEDVLASSSSTESSSPRENSRRFGLELQEGGHANRELDDSRPTTTPTIRSRSCNGLESSRPAALLSPINRKNARLSLNEQEDNATKRRKRQIQTKTQGTNKHEYSRAPDQGDMSFEVGSRTNLPSTSPSTSQDHEMEMCESPRHLRSEQSYHGYSDLVVNDAAHITPLPATQLFLSKLKGQRRRPENELLYGKPAWVTIAHVGRFFRAATRLEREHSRFLHVRALLFLPRLLYLHHSCNSHRFMLLSCFAKANARRLMQAEKAPLAEIEHVSGSMHYLAKQLGDLTHPSDVIAVGRACKLKAAQDEGRELREPSWINNEERSSSATAKAAAALISPDNEPALHLPSLDKDEDILLEHLYEITTDPVSAIKDYQPTAAAPHFNAFDDDGNLQLQSA